MGARERLDAVWRAALSEPLAVRAAPAELTKALVEGLPPAPPGRVPLAAATREALRGVRARAILHAVP